MEVCDSVEKQTAHEIQGKKALLGGNMPSRSP